MGLVLVPIVLLVKTPPRGAAESAANPSPATQPKLTAAEIYRGLFQTLRHSPALVLTIAATVLLNFSTSAGSYVFTWLVRYPN